MTPSLTLISHPLCPYVQRVAIVLAEKSLPFERVAIDLADKPAWFLAISPLGKTPVLLVDGVPLFESAAICEYLDDEFVPEMHPRAALARARHRAWMEFASTVLANIAALYSASSDEMFSKHATDLQEKFARLEQALSTNGRDGPFFAGAHPSLVDAAFAPVFRYFDAFGHLEGLDFLDAMPAVAQWRAALRARPSVRDAVDPSYAVLLEKFLLAKQSAMAAALRASDVALNDG
jgi:glutathione S-transferase